MLVKPGTNKPNYNLDVVYSPIRIRVVIFFMRVDLQLGTKGIRHFGLDCVK